MPVHGTRSGARVAHEDSDNEEQGASGSLRLAGGAPHGAVFWPRADLGRDRERCGEIVVGARCAETRPWRRVHAAEPSGRHVRLRYGVGSSGITSAVFVRRERTSSRRLLSWSSMFMSSAVTSRSPPVRSAWVAVRAIWPSPASSSCFTLLRLRCFCRLVRVSQGSAREYELHAPRFTQSRNFLATRGSLLEQGTLKHEVRFDVDAHAVASNSTRPSLTAV